MNQVSPVAAGCPIRPSFVVGESFPYEANPDSRMMQLATGVSPQVHCAGRDMHVGAEIRIPAAGQDRRNQGRQIGVDR